jgi:3alpha(or 20beta)-hydroxysteroid dehydrogenase
MGKFHARYLAERGANVVVTDILEEGESIARELGDRGLFIRLDVSQAADWANAVERTQARFGAINGLVNNAGIGYVVQFDDLSEAEYRKYIDINQMSVFFGMKAVVPAMRRAGGGSIVNVSSTAGLRAGGGILAYVGTKFAVTGMTKAAAIDLGPDGIRVNSIHPGLIGRTGLFERAGSYHDPLIAKTPLRRIGEPEEVSALVTFLLSDDSRYCTGSEFVIDGGFLAQQ